MKNLNTIIKIILALLFIGALFKMPYNYYEIMRFLGMVGFAILGYNELKKENSPFIIVWFASALLINPFFKLALGRSLWNIIDVIWVILLLLSMKYQKSE